MLVRLKPEIDYANYDDELKGVLESGAVLRAYIYEYMTNDEDEGWYLVETGIHQTANFNSDSEVLNGAITRPFRDPNLPDNYRNGPYLWIEARHCEQIHNNNLSAKCLLSSYEWRL